MFARAVFHTSFDEVLKIPTQTWCTYLSCKKGRSLKCVSMMRSGETSPQWLYFMWWNSNKYSLTEEKIDFVQGMGLNIKQISSNQRLLENFATISVFN